MNSFDKSQLIKLFDLPPEGFRNIYRQISTIYQNSPVNFASAFFDKLPTMNPKSVRIICYQLYLSGIGMDKVYLQYNRSPKFLKKLDKFPLETMMVLLKYLFPANPKGDLFFLHSLTKNIEAGETPGPYPSNLDWLDFTLDVCLHQEINLNHLNQSTGSTCLHSAIRMSSLPVVQLLLSHRVNPNIKSNQGTSPLFSAIESLELPEIDVKISVEIIRQLRRYGANIDNMITEQIKMSSYRDQVNRALSIGELMKPEFAALNNFYFSLDPTEDLILIAVLDPSVIEDANFPPTPPSFRNAIKIERDKTIFVNNIMWGWPYYINDTSLSNDQQCYLEIDKRVTSSSPPDSIQVYRQALDNIPDYQPRVIIDLTTETPSDNTVPPTEFSELIPTFPLSSGPLLPTGNPQLPSL